MLPFALVRLLVPSLSSTFHDESVLDAPSTPAMNAVDCLIFMSVDRFRSDRLWCIPVTAMAAVDDIGC